MYLLFEKLAYMTSGIGGGYIEYPSNMLGQSQNYFFERFKYLVTKRDK